MYGSTETNAFRTSTSPSPGSGRSTSASSKSVGTGAPLGRAARRISLERATGRIVRRSGGYPAVRPCAALTESFKTVVTVPRGSSSCGHRRATQNPKEDARRRRRRELQCAVSRRSCRSPSSSRRRPHPRHRGRCGRLRRRAVHRARRRHYLCPVANAGAVLLARHHAQGAVATAARACASARARFPPGLSLASDGASAARRHRPGATTST